MTIDPTSRDSSPKYSTSPRPRTELVSIERALQEREERREQLFSPEGLAAMHGHSSA